MVTNRFKTKRNLHYLENKIKQISKFLYHVCVCVCVKKMCVCAYMHARVEFEFVELVVYHGDSVYITLQEESLQYLQKSSSKVKAVGARVLEEAVEFSPLEEALTLTVLIDSAMRAE